ncbi:MAG: DUF4071 domain-containing protein [Desulfobacter sp.]|nr:MAG: DUF4071 domain-containing protein [Desulfobacter sp.]
MLPLCFILMPFGQKRDGSGRIIDFDAVYTSIIAPAVKQAGLAPLRADEEMAGGVIHKPMFERLVLCDFAVADLTTANANVFYELGVRHAVRPFTTVLFYCRGRGQLPFDVAPLRALHYELGPDGKPCNEQADISALKDQLIHAKKTAQQDSPVFNFLEDFPEISHTKTDVFRDRVDYSQQIKKQLTQARKKGVDAIRAIEKEMGDLSGVDAGPVIDLFLSYRGVKAWPDMIRLAGTMPPPLAATVMVREQLALALNRHGRWDEAEELLLELIEQRGPSSETYGILGRVYKDRWETLALSGETYQAGAYLKKAVAAYLKGFETDFRDAYPGINALTLMEISDPPDDRRHHILPVVRYAVERKIASGKPDYWDHATRLELAVLARDEKESFEALDACLISVREIFEPETTLRNLRLIREAREKRKGAPAWSAILEKELAKKAKSP